MKKLLFVTAVVCFFTLSAGDTFACSCSTIDKTTEEAVKESFQASSAIFSATVVSVKKDWKRFAEQRTVTLPTEMR